MKYMFTHFISNILFIQIYDSDKIESKIKSYILFSLFSNNEYFKTLLQDVFQSKT